MSLTHGDDLRKRRVRLGLSQAELAARLDIPANTIARWERGEVPVRHWRMLFRALNDLADELAAETDQEIRRQRNERAIALRDAELAAGRDS